LKKISSARVTALADIDAQALDLASRVAPDAVCFESPTELLKSNLVDAVIIATPSDSHAGVAAAAFVSGLHAYVEKPIANDVESAQAIIDAWKQSGRIGAIGFNYRFNRLYQKLHSALDKGRIGQPTRISTTFIVPRPIGTNWRAKVNTGGGALADLGSHHIDLVRFLSGDEVDTVNAQIRSRTLEGDFARLELSTRRGITAKIVVGFGDAFTHTFRVEGTRGNASIDIAASHDIEVNDRQRRFPTPARLAHIYRKLQAPLHEPSYRPALESFISAINTNGSASPDLNDGMEALKVVAAAERSNVSRMPITMG
jgi:myo-inositol 2-dehydrogenase/D-chiro-inositol 1-dehydrogenase